MYYFKLSYSKKCLYQVMVMDSVHTINPKGKFCKIFLGKVTANIFSMFTCSISLPPQNFGLYLGRAQIGTNEWEKTL